MTDEERNRLIAPALTRLSRIFRSQFSLINLTQGKAYLLEKSLTIYQIAMRNGDCCQLVVQGIDAELACFTVKELFQIGYSVIKASHNQPIPPQIARLHPDLQINCDYRLHFRRAHTTLSKFETLHTLAELICPKHRDDLLLALIKREECSSTAVAAGLALPHVMFEGVDRLSIAMLGMNNDKGIDWQSNLGDISTAIAVILPASPHRTELIAATNLTRNLLHKRYAHRLAYTYDPVDKQALLIYGLSKLI